MMLCIFNQLHFLIGTSKQTLPWRGWRWFISLRTQRLIQARQAGCWRSQDCAIGVFHNLACVS